MNQMPFRFCLSKRSFALAFTIEIMPNQTALRQPHIGHVCRRVPDKTTMIELQATLARLVLPGDFLGCGCRLMNTRLRSLAGFRTDQSQRDHDLVPDPVFLAGFELIT